MKLTRKSPTVFQGRRKDGCLVTVEGPPKRSKCVWQVNHGTQSARVRDWFETKREAVKFAETKAIPVNTWEEIYICAYSDIGARRFYDKLLGHKNAER